MGQSKVRFQQSKVRFSLFHIKWIGLMSSIFCVAASAMYTLISFSGFWGFLWVSNQLDVFSTRVPAMLLLNFFIAEPISSSHLPYLGRPLLPILSIFIYLSILASISLSVLLFFICDYFGLLLSAFSLFFYSSNNLNWVIFDITIKNIFITLYWVNFLYIAIIHVVNWLSESFLATFHLKKLTINTNTSHTSYLLTLLASYLLAVAAYRI